MTGPVYQHTLARSASWQSEQRRRRTDVLVVHPADVDTGVRFVCRGSPSTDGMIPARWDAVVDTRGGVVLGNTSGWTLRGAITLLAALRVAGIDNAVVEFQGSRISAEVGDFCFYLEMLADVGVRVQDAARRLLSVTDRVEVRDSSGFAILTPDSRFRASVQATAIRHGGRADTVYATLLSDFTEPHAGFSTTLPGSGEIQNNGSGDAPVTRPLREICASPDAMRIGLVEMVGHLALAGAPLAGNLRTYGAGPGLHQALLHAVMDRRAAAPTTVTAHRARHQAAQADELAQLRPLSDTDPG